MIRNHMRIWLLHPDFTVRQFGELPAWLDETDERGAVEQLGARWQPLEVPREMVSVTVTVPVKPEHDKDGKEKPAFPTILTYPALRIDERNHLLFGAIHLRHELVMLYEDGIVNIPRSGKFGRVTLTCAASQRRAGEGA